MEGLLYVALLVSIAPATFLVFWSIDTLIKRKRHGKLKIGQVWRYEPVPQDPWDPVEYQLNTITDLKQDNDGVLWVRFYRQYFNSPILDSNKCYDSKEQAQLFMIGSTLKFNPNNQ